MRSLQRVDVGDSGVLELVWDDGSVQRLAPDLVRAACPCAACRGAFVVPDPGAVRIHTARVVGDYALGFGFEPDGHGAGIYPFDLLASL